MTESSYLKKFQKELKAMFRSEDKDFNWGIYRIMNQKNKEITDYVDKELPKIVEEKLRKLKGDFGQKNDEELKTLEENLINAGVDPNTSPKYKKLVSQKKKGVSLKEFEEQIYNHLLEFFSRYYQDGDFISQFYFKDDTYLIPYDGSEVALHWATKDMYYVKSSDQYQRFSFLTKDEKKSVLLKLVSREEEKGNQKGRDKYFVFDDLEWNNNELVCNICYVSPDDKTIDLGKNKTERQNKLNSEIADKIKDKLGDHVNDLDILKNIKKFQRRYVEDFFIHKDLKGFLEGQMNFFINQNILNVDSLIDESGNFNEDLKIIAKVFKDICKSIIEKLDLLEQMKKRIWEKKKFVLETNYVITLDKIKEFISKEFLEEIIDQILSNEKQIKEWKELFGFDIKTKKDLIGENTLDGINYKKLSIDTKYFDDEFKWSIINKIDDLDEKLNGLLIHSENWQGLNLIKNKYASSIRLIYIDPNYNTGSDDFLYKDSFQNSSWMSMSENRLSLAFDLLSDEGVIFTSIGIDENSNLEKIQKSIFKNDENYIGNITRIQKKGSDQGNYFGPSIDYIQVFSKDKQKLPNFIDLNEDIIKNFSKIEIDGPRKNEKYEDSKSLYQSSLDPLRGCKNQRYFIECPDGSLVIPPGNIFPKEKKDGCNISPKTRNDKVWRWSYETYLENKYKIVFKKTKSSPLIDSEGKPSEWNVYTKRYLNDFLEKGNVPSNLFDGFTNSLATSTLNNLGLNFSFSKPYELIQYIINIVGLKNNEICMDFFSGSGTTSHGAISFSKKNDIKIKFFLMEIADYFYTIIIPRTKKTLFSLNWEKGIPKDMNSIGGFFKYQEMEQYEDALENVILKQSTLEMFNDNLDILLKYYLDDGIDPNKSKNFLGVDTEKEFLDLRINVLNKDGTTRQQKGTFHYQRSCIKRYRTFSNPRLKFH